MADKDQVRLSRIARRVNASLIEGHRKCKAEAVSSSGMVTESLEEVLKIRRLFAWADQRDMPAARTSLFEQLMRQVRYLSGQVGSVQKVLEEVQQAPKQLTLAETVAELTQLETEFDQQVVFDRANQTLSVSTEAIELEDIFLGAFTINLKLARLRNSSHSHFYSVSADDPNPATGNDHVTHPHVSNEELCEGDAGMPIRAALAQGRLCDFFILVRSVLQTYNPDSPYVRLDEWSGVPCHDCGSSMNSDDICFCESCEHDFCPDCMSSCHVCGDSSCRECLETCPSCDEHVCDRCLRTCDKCGKSMCTSCLTKCPTCGNKVCDDCLTTCADCGTQFCDSCVQDGRCADCNDKRQPEPVKEPDHGQEVPPTTPTVTVRRRRRTTTTTRRRTRRAVSA